MYLYVLWVEFSREDGALLMKSLKLMLGHAKANPLLGVLLITDESR